MSDLRVVFEVPKVIEAGLRSGTLERVGGVIRDSATKQVVVWLRDGSMVTQTLNAGANASPLSLVLTAARMGTTLLDGHLTRRVVEGVAQQVQIVTNLVAFTAAGQTINLAVSGASLAIMMRRVERLSESVAELGERVTAEFARDRIIDFRAALQTARDAFEGNHVNSRENAAHDARQGLYKAREHLLKDFEQNLQLGEAANLLTAQHELIYAMYAETSRIRCYLALGETELAKTQLLESIPGFRQNTIHLIQAWLGQHPAVFFHENYSTEDLERFLRIQAWIRDMENEHPERQLFAIIDDLRQSFWNPDVIEHLTPDSRFQRLRKRVGRPKEESNENLDVLSMAEMSIENLDRLRGFELELRSMRLGLEDWMGMISESELEQHEMGMILDVEALKGLGSKLTVPN